MVFECNVLIEQTDLLADLSDFPKNRSALVHVVLDQRGIVVEYLAEVNFDFATHVDNACDALRSRQTLSVLLKTPITFLKNSKSVVFSADRNT